ncbi:hypothetical protein KY290_031523 [Solanum tuberosum]|uniref:Uncharacterized protein n=1 Tax=Solanum tuberosum TaxID=4113 RepID=A0ABQ7U9E7_SOLTU|nr:hypothetical protein KY284_030573 [Solanum tuberosum]KAH0655870.1 hypothetical protein KY285_030752 [Solanum tuberosum]KAH0743530.1 hypothetical protein KY290_031523 [Solanum tuberosum]
MLCVDPQTLPQPTHKTTISHLLHISGRCCSPGSTLVSTSTPRWGSVCRPDYISPDRAASRASHPSKE